MLLLLLIQEILVVDLEPFSDVADAFVVVVYDSTETQRTIMPRVTMSYYDDALHLHLEASQFHIKGFVREYLYKCHYSGFDSETRMVTGLQAKSEILNFAGD